jgi:NAD(P)-dependent dehydrogenase (short-subunit alcohol dehydrogenase family)
VTGAGRKEGIGHAIAVALAEAGADVAVNELPPAAGGHRLRELVAEIEARGQRALALPGDVSSRDDAERMVSDVVEGMGGLHILVNNAATRNSDHKRVAWEIPEDAYDTVMRVNAKSVFLMSTAAIRRFLAAGVRGRIINIASDAGRRGVAYRSAYCASKFAIIGMTQAMALELAPRGVTVNAICPGLIETAKRLGGPGSDPASEAVIVPVGRQGTPADIARAALFLADPAADYITGQSLSVDGGLVM